MSFSTTPLPPHHPTPAGRSIDRLARAARYRLHDFLDDQKRLVSSGQSDPSLRIGPLSGHDEGMLTVRLQPSLSAVRARQRATSVFTRKYGPGIGSVRLSQFCRVLEFLEHSGTAIAHAGLTKQGEPMAVHREFLRFLLDWKPAPAQGRIPECALQRFLDDWGHRWM